MNRCDLQQTQKKRRALPSCSDCFFISSNERAASISLVPLVASSKRNVASAFHCVNCPIERERAAHWRARTARTPSILDLTMMVSLPLENFTSLNLLISPIQLVFSCDYTLTRIIKFVNTKSSYKECHRCSVAFLNVVNCCYSASFLSLISRRNGNLPVINSWRWLNSKGKSICFI